MKTDSELISLIALIDDPDKVVREAVMQRLIERGEDTVMQIEDYLRVDNQDDREQTILSYLDDIKAKIALRKLAEIMDSPQPPLDLALYYITKIAETSCNEILFFGSTEKLVNEVNLELSDEKTPVEKIKIFNYLFFKRFNFHHTDLKMHDPDSALLDHVVMSRGGNPVAISLLYFLLAREAGLPVYPLCFTGGFVPVYLDNNGEVLFYLNIFKQGSIFLEDTLVQFFEDIGLEYKPESTKIEEERALVTIYAELLGFIYKNIENTLVLERIDRIMEIVGGGRYL